MKIDSEMNTCPIRVGSVTDWYRDGNVTGRDNSHLAIGSNITWAYKIRQKMNSPWARNYVHNSYLAVF